MGQPPFTPAPAPGATPRQPLPPAIEAARREGERIGRVYGDFQAVLEQEFFLFFSDMGGKLANTTVWDRLSPDERKKLLSTNSQRVQALPKLPATASLTEAAAQRDGFRSGSGRAYESK